MASGFWKNPEDVQAITLERHNLLQFSLPMRIILINLDHDTDRRRSVEAQLQKLRLPWERLSAIDGNLLTQQHEALVDQQAQAKLGGRGIGPGYIGSWLSHRYAHRMIIENNDDMGLILEDDISIHDDLPEVLNKIECIGAEKFDLVKLSRTNLEKKYMPVQNIGSKHTMGLVKFCDNGAQAYVITREAALCFIDRVPRMVHTLDSALCRYWETGINILWLDPPIVFHADNGKSSIHARGGNRCPYTPSSWIRKQLRQIVDFYPRQKTYYQRASKVNFSNRHIHRE